MTVTRQLVIYTILAYALSWVIWLPGVLRVGSGGALEDLGLLLLLGTLGPSFAAIIVTALNGGWAAVRELLAKMLRWRVGWKPYIFLFVTPLVFLLGLLGLGLRPVAGVLPFLALQVVVLMPVNAVFTSLLEAGPLGEELGWRGFMLPRLLESFGDLRSSLILGLIWAFWHLPFFIFIGWRSGISVLTFTLLYPLTIIAFSFAMTKLYHWTKGSVLIAILMHGAVNFTTAQLIDPEAFVLSSRSSLGVYVTMVGAFVLLALTFWALDKYLFAERGSRERGSTANSASS